MMNDLTGAIRISVGNYESTSMASFTIAFNQKQQTSIALTQGFWITLALMWQVRM